METKDGGSTNRDVALKYGVQYLPYIKIGQYYRLFTAMFLHFGPSHLLFNMYALSVIGPAVERVCGPVFFLIIYDMLGYNYAWITSKLFFSLVCFNKSRAE